MNERRRKTDWFAFFAFVALWVAFVGGLARGEHNRAEGDKHIRAAAVERSAQIKAEAERRTAQIEESRRDVIVRACREQNRRHDAAIEAVDTLLEDAPAAERAESRARTVFLVERMLPHRDCAKRAQRLIRP